MVTRKRQRIAPSEWFDIESLEAIRVEYASGRPLYEILDQDYWMEQPDRFCDISEALIWLESKFKSTNLTAAELCARPQIPDGMTGKVIVYS